MVHKFDLILLLNFAILCFVITQVGFLFLGLQPYILYQSTEEIQGMEPDVLLSLNVEQDQLVNTSKDLLIFESITNPSNYFLPIISNDMLGVYTSITINGTSTWPDSENYWSGCLIGLDNKTLEAFAVLIGHKLSINETNVLLIQDSKETYYKTDFQPGDQTEIFSIYSGNTTAFKKRFVTITDLLELDYPTSDYRNKHDFPLLIPQNIFEKRIRLIFITSIDGFNKLYQTLQNPSKIEYTIFRHLWFDRSDIKYQNLGETFTNVNYYLSRTSERADFEYEEFIVQSHNFLFDSPILEALNAASSTFESFLLIGIILSLPLIGGAFLFASFLNNIYQEKTTKEKLLLRLRGYPLQSLMSSLIKEYSLNIGGGVILGIICVFFTLLLYTGIYSHFFQSYSFTKLNIKLNIIFQVLLIVLFAISIFAGYRIRKVYLLIVGYSKKDYVENEINKVLQTDEYLDVYFFLIGIVSICGEFIFQRILPHQFQLLVLKQFLFFLNLIGFFSIILSSLGLIRRTIGFMERNSFFLPFFRKSLLLFQILIVLRQKRHYIRLIQLLTFIILSIQLLIIFNHSVYEQEKNRALYQTGAEGYINSPTLSPDLIEHFNVVKNTSITSVTVQFYEGEFNLLGIDPNSFFEVAYLTQRLSESSIVEMITKDYGVFYNHKILGKSIDHQLTLHYHNSSFELLSVNLTLIEEFSSWPRLQEGISPSDANLLVINRRYLHELLSEISGGDIVRYEEGSLVEIDEEGNESSFEFFTFDGYSLDYYRNRMNILLLDLLSAELLYFFTNGMVLSILSVFFIFSLIVKLRGKVLSLDLITGMSQKAQFLLLELSNQVILIISIIYGTIMSILATICLLNLYQLFDLEFPIALRIPGDSLLVTTLLFMFFSFLSLPFRQRLYHRENLFENIRDM